MKEFLINTLTLDVYLLFGILGLLHIWIAIGFIRATYEYFMEFKKEFPYYYYSYRMKYFAWKRGWYK